MFPFQLFSLGRAARFPSICLSLTHTLPLSLSASVFLHLSLPAFFFSFICLPSSFFAHLFFSSYLANTQTHTVHTHTLWPVFFACVLQECKLGRWGGETEDEGVWRPDRCSALRHPDLSGQQRDRQQGVCVCLNILACVYVMCMTVPAEIHSCPYVASISIHCALY